MLNMIRVMRHGASLAIFLFADDSNYLSLCQILESTDDVTFYQVAKLNGAFKPIDRYLESNQGFPKWYPMIFEKDLMK